LFIGSRIYSKDYNDIEDCLQEVFLIVIRKAKTENLEQHPNLKGWLFEIAKNIAYKFNTAYMKTKSGLCNFENLGDIDSLHTADFTKQLLEDMVYGEIDQEQLIDTMKSGLTASEREIFELRMQSFSNTEIAALLNKSESTVKSTYSRLKPKLKQIIFEEVN
jgi:RNA polymerase sigma factor (sigma-70 family)